ncbi:gap junction protein alpha 4 [Boleophthalmus pectinirostris]|uniref:gap junction protein alpha 4 n=1 Tax=Boleophthalmus pectinirostris TaxID=150288 RepID=UPI00242E3F02|nr:gap junction protein alpha 4 [Boleophthalmus pectinirostris]XP_055013641.1 gap junction protein alpha 4 [Boleophthalmus pectinirostris]
MSRADWSFLEHLLEEGQEYSTSIGRVWLTVLFLFRMLVLGTAAESAWDDEQADFVCNTRQPGCTAVCYDKAFPISHFRYFVLQVIFVSAPTIFYFGYVAIRARTDTSKDDGQDGGESVIELKRKDNEEKDKRGKKCDKGPLETPKLKGKLLCAYTFSILLKVILEAGFIVGLWFLYDGFLIATKFECTRAPCPHTVDCFVSRPTEKSIFTVYTQVIAVISLILNLVELFHLLQIALMHNLEKQYQAEQTECRPQPRHLTAPQEEIELQTTPTRSHSDMLSSQGGATVYQNSCESYTDFGIEVNWSPEETPGDLLPSYVNCMGAMRTNRSPRVNYKKNLDHSGKHSKGAHKHYV